MDADGPHRFRNGPFGRDVVQAPGGASDLSHSETRCAAFAGAGASSASTTCRFRESIPHPVQPLSTLRTPRYRDARKTRSRPACSALDGPDFHWQAHSSFPIAPRIRLRPGVGNGEAYGRPRTEDFRLWEPVGSEASDVQVVFLLLAATPQRAPRECQIPWSGKAIAKPTTA